MYSTPGATWAGWHNFRNAAWQLLKYYWYRNLGIVEFSIQLHWWIAVKAQSCNKSKNDHQLINLSSNRLLQDHLEKCERAKVQCDICRETFKRPSHVNIPLFPLIHWGMKKLCLEDNEIVQWLESWRKVKRPCVRDLVIARRSIILREKEPLT